MAGYIVMYNDRMGINPITYWDYPKEEVIRMAKAEGLKRKAYKLYVGRLKGDTFGSTKVGEWELRGTRWYKV